MAAYLNEPPAPTAAQLAKIEALLAEASRQRAKSEESFRRSDTDGFLSQWALDIGARLNERKADLLRHGGYARFPVLCDADGNVIAERIFTFPDRERPWISALRWRLPDDLAERAGRRWVPVMRAKPSRVQRQLGLHEEDRWYPAFAKITTGNANSTGLAGCANAYVGIFKRGEE
jgi:hypothetical protein